MNLKKRRATLRRCRDFFRLRQRRSVALLFAKSLAITLPIIVPIPTSAQPSPVIQWWTQYTESEIAGPHVLGFWKFDGEGDDFLRDASSHGHAATLRGATHNPSGRFGGCLESAAGYPHSPESHSIHVTRSPVLSPRGAFTTEMWISAKDAEAFPETVEPVLLDMKYLAHNHSGFMFSLTKAKGDGTRNLSLEIGLGTRSEQWYSRPFLLKPDRWRHVAFEYDAHGTVTFFLDGNILSRVHEPDAGAMAEATRPLSIGDRAGSNYRGFPGYIDEVRITSGKARFLPYEVEPRAHRAAFVRMEKDAALEADLVNRSAGEISGLNALLQMPDGKMRYATIGTLEGGKSKPMEIPIDTSLKPGTYEVKVTVAMPNWGGVGAGFMTKTSIPFTIVSRPLAHRMPVVMWGLGGTEGVVKEIDRLRDIGFTHCFGLQVDYQAVWDKGSTALPRSPEEIREGRDMLDRALENDVQIVVNLKPGRWLRTSKVGEPFLRIDRNGRHYSREDVSGQFPKVLDFCYNTGAAVGRAFGDHPALTSALINTEIRGESNISFLPIDLAACKKATGADVPEGVATKNGMDYRKMKDFPEDRVIADDNPILRFYQWFWTEGDGWNEMHTRVHDGLKAHVRNKDFWTFHDPAARVPSIGGNGGAVDVLAHWTYSYPDPIRIGMCADELFEMARANGRGQDVMKMTQVIWYRSQTAPAESSPEGDPSPWVDQDPDAAYITIAPMHLREAFWWKMARPITGIMYHGWQSLVETDSPGAYRYTNPNAQHELKRLVADVVVPLGPTLLQVPDPKTDVVFFESFTSQMFARRGTYGWNHRWAGDVYHILMYSQLQPRILYEESLAERGLDGAKVLVMVDCDVLTESVVKKIKAFQDKGGLVVGDANLCPAIKANYVIPAFSRTKKADIDRKQLLAASKDLRSWLDEKYSRVLDSENPDVVTRRRRSGSTDYLFAVNDNREFGTYLGNYGLVMENGLPSETVLSLARKKGYVYDLVTGRETRATAGNGKLKIPLALGPCEGRVLMVTDRPIRELTLSAPKTASPGASIEINLAVTDGNKAVDAVVPIKIRIIDPEGVEAEFSGHYGAAAGRLVIPFDFASNDRTGVWEIRARELASGLTATAYVRVAESD